MIIFGKRVIPTFATKLKLEMSIAFTQSHNDKIRDIHSQICEKYYNSNQQYEGIMSTMLELETYLAEINYDPFIKNKGGIEKLAILAQLRDCYEIGTKSALSLSKESEFNSWIDLLMMIYFNYDGLLSESTEQEKIMTYYILKLLCQEQYEDFYCTMERIPYKLQLNGQLIKQIFQIQKDLISGDYRKIYEIIEKFKKDTNFKYFANPLLNIVRREHAITICSCSKIISINDFQKQLRFNSINDTHEFILNQVNWIIDGDYIKFNDKIIKNNEPIIYSMVGDLKNRLCAHLNKPASECEHCSSTDSNLTNIPREIVMDVPIDYPKIIVEAVEEYGDFITLFDSLL